MQELLLSIASQDDGDRCILDHELPALMEEGLEVAMALGPTDKSKRRRISIHSLRAKGRLGSNAEHL